MTIPVSGSARPTVRTDGIKILLVPCARRDETRNPIGRSSSPIVGRVTLWIWRNRFRIREQYMMIEKRANTTASVTGFKNRLKHTAKREPAAWETRLTDSGCNVSFRDRTSRLINSVPKLRDPMIAMRYSFIKTENYV
jgi:hypothetical protein